MKSMAVIGSVLIKSEPVEELDTEQTVIDQPANMANQQESEDERNGDQLKLALSYSSRDQLFTCLNQLSAILQCNQSLSDDSKQSIRKQIKKSILLLVDLSPFEQTSFAEDSTVFEQLTFELSGEEQTTVMNLLMNNQNAVLFDDQMSDEIKRSLVTENSQVVLQMLELPSRVYSNCGGDLRLDEDNGEPPSKKQRVESGLNEELDNLKAVTKRQEKKIAKLEAKMDGMRGELKREIKNVDITRSEASFKFELPDVAEFFETDGKLHSERFWCRGLQWSIKVRSNLHEDRLKYLAFYLNCHNEDLQKWSCKVDYKLILFNYWSKSENNFFETVYTFGNRTSFGCSNFISYRELTNKKNGYLRDDKIVLGAKLKAGPVFRGIQSENS